MRRPPLRNHFTLCDCLMDKIVLAPFIGAPLPNCGVKPKLKVWIAIVVGDTFIASPPVDQRRLKGGWGDGEAYNGCWRCCGVRRHGGNWGRRCLWIDGWQWIRPC